jgi:rubrerythrin
MADLNTRLNKAIQDERQAQSEYRALAQEAAAQDRETLLAMAEDERRHEQNLQRIVEQRRTGTPAR